jgi:hypothetical protein
MTLVTRPELPLGSRLDELLKEEALHLLILRCPFQFAVLLAIQQTGKTSGRPSLAGPLHTGEPCEA